MSSSKANSNNGAGKAPKRGLPSWMSARDDKKDDKPADDIAVGDEVEGTEKKFRGQGKGVKDRGEASGSGNSLVSSGPSSSNFSKLLDGVVFALSGFVNPERGVMRSRALEMGAEYQPDWNGNCTLLVCAFRNTPKFRQVEADGGTIVSKDWIAECYTQKKLVDIETYLMHVGKPWRKTSISHEGSRANETSRPRKPRKLEVKEPEVEPKASTSSNELKGNASRLGKEFSPSKVKKWAMDDLTKTLAWLESQEEKPEAREMRNVAAEGILTCLQDAVDLLDKMQDLQQLTEQWNMIPRVVEEIIRVQASESPSSTTKEDLHKQALTWKKIYEAELREIADGSKTEETRLKTSGEIKDTGDTAGDRDTNAMDYDSDETIEMTEDEINAAYYSIASRIIDL